jgi:predicted ribosomally synthesized peptide with nif11-like leader
MSTTELERLVRDYGADQALRGRIDAAADAGQAAELARSAGYKVTADEMQARRTARLNASAELTSRQLDAVAGGAGMSHANSSFF